ncbi:phytanoyl-CoA dioxygenase family protein [Nocardia sp. NBC_01327]|uniref:phytanoyl-CoA dioxygenase family protein n=1 Tax=Nocardia sp. NBC_01327 TaxID=2903593 RepID=UPI002E14500D|nr:phytanoyl-CoA dioxygenase family protein [Nocardia sp. NBC_01327]
MQLTVDQIGSYEESGFLVLESVLSPSEVDVLLEAMVRDSGNDGPYRLMSDDSNELSTLYASHQRVGEFAELVRTPRLLCPAQTILGGDVYVYQFKINVKSAFGKEKVAWHQDYTAWKIADELPNSRLINVALLLDEATEFNGPLIFVPGSHKVGNLRENRDHSPSSAKHLDPEDIALRPQNITHLIDECGMKSVQAPVGSLVLFSPEIIHGSAPNMSPAPRRLLIATYNSCSNLPRVAEPRPSYLVGDDSTPLKPQDKEFERLDERLPVGSSK